MTPHLRGNHAGCAASHERVKHYAAYPPKLVETCLLAGCPEGGIVLDPFMGSGTTGMVASQMGRHFVGIELNPEYTELAYKRIGGEI